MDTTNEIFVDILRQHETILDLCWKNAIKRKAFDDNLQLKTNFRTVITIPAKDQTLLKLKYMVGNGDELVCFIVSMYIT